MSKELRFTAIRSLFRKKQLLELLSDVKKNEQRYIVSARSIVYLFTGMPALINLSGSLNG